MTTLTNQESGLSTRLKPFTNHKWWKRCDALLKCVKPIGKYKKCFQHLIIAFEWLSPNFIPALNKPEPPNTDGIFRPSWLIKRFPNQFDPQSEYKTLKANNPTAVYSREVLTRWLVQQIRLADMIEQATHANLQTMCRIIKWLPIRYNLGDYLNFFISHDELHIDQAKRVVAAYESRVANEV